MKKPDWRSKRNIKWIEKHCKIPDGKFVGAAVKLRPWQKDEIRKIYDNPAGTRTAIMSFGRKNAKTTLSAFILLLHLAGSESQENSQLVSTAQSRDQAAVIFELAAKIVRMSPTLHPVIGLRDSSKQMYCAARGTTFKAMSAEAKTAFGKSISLAIHDEIGQVVGPRSLLYESVETSAGAHDNPLSILISTQAPTDADLFSVLIDDALANNDPKVTVSLYTAPIEDNPFLVSTIKKANPAYGDFLNSTEVRKQAGEAERMPSREAAYRNLILNQRVNMSSPFIPAAVWNACSGEAEEEAFQCGTIGIGLDLSARNDLTALVTAAFYKGVYHIRPEFFVPLDGVKERSLRDRVPYDLWVKQGYIHATPGASVDYEPVAHRLIEICDDYDVAAINFDRWRIDVLKREVERFGAELPLIEFGQGYKDMAPAMDITESVILNGCVRHGANPVLTMCCANSVVDIDPAGNRKLNKHKSTGRIDGMVAMIMAITATSGEVERFVSGSLITL
jgi:phage terminase large subunit-like protein